MTQEQKGGMGSTNIQIGTVSAGISYSDVRDIASDLFQANFANLMALAKDEAEKRASEIRDEIISRLERDPSSNPNAFSQVEKQVILLEAQKAYAVSGDEELKDILIKAVVDASSAPERSKKSIILGEAIKIAPLLTKNQIKALGIAFAIRFLSFRSPTKITELFDAYLHAIDLKIENIEMTAGDIRHMEYLGCGTLSIGSISFYEIISREYHGLISAGYTSEELKAAFFPEAIPIPMRRSARDPKKMEIATHRQDIIDQTAWTDRQKSIAKQKIVDRLISEADLIAELENHSNLAVYLYKQWSESNLHSFQITSVGIAIGYTYISERASLADLNIWL